MEIYLIAFFILGYVAITMEHSLKLDKLIPALLMMVACWTVIAINVDNITFWIDAEGKAKEFTGGNYLGIEHVNKTLLHHFGKTVEILVIMMGAMAIVEMIEYFDGFSSIKDLIKSRKKTTILWIVSIIAFLLSSIIYNMLATIVLITVLRKIISNKEDRMWYSGFIIIAANAGGCWTPVGDITTTMLWSAHQVSTGNLMLKVGVPSLICILLPLIAALFMPVFRGEIELVDEEKVKTKKVNPNSKFMLYFGLILIIFVPIFETITHLPPYLGMMGALALFSVTAESLVNSKKGIKRIISEVGVLHQGPTMKALSKVEMPSFLFFLGILMTVAALQSTGMIYNLGEFARNSEISKDVIVISLGLISAIIDNVPLVAASFGMFNDLPGTDVWYFIAYAAGTGGSILIIGSAAGVVAMGMEKISFFWYFKNIALLAALGYFGGIAFFILFRNF